MKRLLTVVALLCLCAFPVLAKSGEATFSASLWNPNEGDTTWSATGEYLFPLGPLVVGPSISMFDLGPVDGGSAGVAGEFNLTGKAGLFIGGAAHKLTGDAADFADYTYEARAGLKLGTGKWFAKLYASQVWSKAADGAVTDPDGTSFQAGIGARF